MTPDNSSLTPVRLETQAFDANHDTTYLVEKGWRCFLNHTSSGVTWILKRHECVAMFVQSLTDLRVQTVQMPSGAESSELCYLLQKAGIARPV